jgi:hypothetical protein
MIYAGGSETISKGGTDLGAQVSAGTQVVSGLASGARIARDRCPWSRRPTIRISGSRGLRPVGNLTWCKHWLHSETARTARLKALIPPNDQGLQGYITGNSSPTGECWLSVLGQGSTP